MVPPKKRAALVPFIRTVVALTGPTRTENVRADVVAGEYKLKTIHAEQYRIRDAFERKMLTVKPMARQEKINAKA